ncbi:hypothetical protein SAMN05216524_10151 [Mucilaginibacter sp. OK098]|nr:hypothetical protein SAMN05216524_10151 [Mucilaginibacter sp. OK098]
MDIKLTKFNSKFYVFKGLVEGFAVSKLRKFFFLFGYEPSTMSFLTSPAQTPSLSLYL